MPGVESGAESKGSVARVRDALAQSELASWTIGEVVATAGNPRVHIT
jgi:hypothetical protein